MITKEQLKNLKTGDAVFGFDDSSNDVIKFIFKGKIDCPSHINFYHLMRNNNRLKHVSETELEEFSLTEKEALQDSIIKTEKALARVNERLQARIKHFTDRLVTAVNDEK